MHPDFRSRGAKELLDAALDTTRDRILGPANEELTDEKSPAGKTATTPWWPAMRGWGC